MNNQPVKFSVALQSEGYKSLINRTLGDPDKAQRFVASISSAVATNPALQLCEAGSILAGALLGEALNLSPSPVLGHYYLVPYDNKNTGTKNAQFQVGYKGYIQLAIRSGRYKKLNVVEVKKGELIEFNPFTEEIIVEPIKDPIKRMKTETIGYYAMFEYIEGFTKAIYWTIEEMENHANTYSKAFKLAEYKKIQLGQIPEKDMWKYSSFWYKNFDMMSKKTMLRQLISHWGIMSIEMQNAFEKDMAIINTDGTHNYVDNSNIPEPTLIPEIDPVADTMSAEEQADAYEKTAKGEAKEKKPASKKTKLDDL